MSLDVSLRAMRMHHVFAANVTHNLTEMADAAGIFKAIWHPEEIGIEKAADLIPILESGLAALKGNPEKFRKLNPSNGWGTYDDFVPWIERYLAACVENPDAEVQAHG